MKTIVLSGPGKNSLSSAVVQATLDAVLAAKDEPIFLTGDGDAFCAGLHLKEIAASGVPELLAYLGKLEALVEALYEHPAPTVAWVNGHAIAGGCIVALACDVRVMSAREGIRIGLNEVALGLKFPPKTFAMVRARLVGPALVRTVLEAGLFDATEAKELGIVTAIGEEADARKRFETLAGFPRGAYADAKKAILPRLDVSEAEAKAFREETIPYWASDTIKSRVRAVLEKKPSAR